MSNRMRNIVDLRIVSSRNCAFLRNELNRLLLALVQTAFFAALIFLSVFILAFASFCMSIKKEIAYITYGFFYNL